MKERFEGPAGKRDLVEALGDQELIRHNSNLAESLSNIASVEEYSESSVLFHQNAPDTDLFFILIGEIDLFINGRKVSVRKAGEALGEIVATDPQATRMVTAVARQNSVVARVDATKFKAIVDHCPDIDVWKTIARVLSNRLRQTACFISLPSEPAQRQNAEPEVTKMQEWLAQNAQKYARQILLLYIGVLFAIWVGLGILTWNFGWDKMEPWTYFIGFGSLIVSYSYLAITHREASPKAIYDHIAERKKKKDYQALGWSLLNSQITSSGEKLK
jgi:CRP-like cAMP-binding protein